MVMDIARTATTRDCKFFRDSETVTKIRWYRAPEGAKFFPEPHRFNHLCWYSFPWLASGPGEVYNTKEEWWRGDTPPGVDGQKFIGTIEDFQLGGQFDPDANYPRNAFGILKACCEDGCTGRRYVFAIFNYDGFPNDDFEVWMNGSFICACPETIFDPFASSCRGDWLYPLPPIRHETFSIGTCIEPPIWRDHEVPALRNVTGGLIDFEIKSVVDNGFANTTYIKVFSVCCGEQALQVDGTYHVPHLGSVHVFVPNPSPH